MTTAMTTFDGSLSLIKFREVRETSESLKKLIIS